jgi:glyoxylase-like metal-dependent hydrolase (beta-lactamase superfamily II)
MVMLQTLVVAVFLFVAPAVSRAASVQLWRLDCGTIQVNDLDLFSDTFRYAGWKKTLADSCYLIRHDGAYMLWDAGLPVNLLDATPGNGPMVPSLGKTLIQQLRVIDVAPEAIALLAVSHNHFDHVGQASAFSRAKLLMGKADFLGLTADPSPFGVDPSLLRPWLQGSLPIEAVTGDKDIFGDGSVVMLSMPGHTPGSYALLVRLEYAGPVLLSGDVVMFEDQLRTSQVPSFNADRAQSLASMARLQEIARTLPATLVMQHDTDDIGKLPLFPASAN